MFKEKTKILNVPKELYYSVIELLRKNNGETVTFIGNKDGYSYIIIGDEISKYGQIVPNEWLI